MVVCKSWKVTMDQGSGSQYFSLGLIVIEVVAVLMLYLIYTKHNCLICLVAKQSIGSGDKMSQAESTASKCMYDREGRACAACIREQDPLTCKPFFCGWFAQSPSKLVIH